MSFMEVKNSKGQKACIENNSKNGTTKAHKSLSYVFINFLTTRRALSFVSFQNSFNISKS